MVREECFLVSAPELDPQLHSNLIQCCRSQTRTAELDLSNVKDELRAFIQQYQSGTRNIKQLISSESLATRKHISASHKETLEAVDRVQKQMTTRLALEADVQADQTKRERLLRSLKFSGFNERRNQVSDAHEDTFEWIFVGDDGPSLEELQGSDLDDSDWEDSDLEDIDLADRSGARWDLFTNWLMSTSKVYWISGKPGSGKTTLAKYVISDPRTTVCLDTWSPQALIISHFLWRPGTPMQQNIKGLLCSLLYQLLENSAVATDHVLQSIKAQRLGIKEEDTDWSVPELRSTFLETLYSYGRAVCIFIDGLDEVHPGDGPEDLLDLVYQFHRNRNAKICLCSRPEPVLEDRLSGFPHLRLQDLTRPDLESYARAHLKSSKSSYDEARSSNAEDFKILIWRLVGKAEGVFLWLILATKSINRGFANGDTSEMIRQRIETLPGDLTKLYQDMWSRACEGNPVEYREIAALYFRLILISQDVPRFASSLLHLMLASTSAGDQLLEAIDDPSALVPNERLLEECRAVERKLRLYCFGLIQPAISFADDRVESWYGSQYNRLGSRYGRKRLQFIHRTAQDFLSDTVDGAEILEYDQTPEISLFFTWARAHLAISQLFVHTQLFGDTMRSNLHEYIDLFGKFPRGVCCSGHPDRTRTISYLEKLCSSGQLVSGRQDNRRFCGDVDFLKAAARIHDEYILSRSRISTFSTETISEILFNVWHGHRGEQIVSSKRSAQPLITMLLGEGADPNWRGHAFNPDSRHRTLGYVNARTPFTIYLRNAIHVERWRHYEPIAWKIRELHMFLSHSANLNDIIHLSFLYKFEGFDTDLTLRSLDVQSALTESSLRFPGERPASNGILIAAFPACTFVKLVLEYLSTRIEHSWNGEDTEYEEMVSLLARSQEYVDNWSIWEHGHIIGKFDRIVVEDPYDNRSREAAWYLPLEGGPIKITDELMKELEKGLFHQNVVYRSSADKIIDQLVQQLSCTPQTIGFRKVCESLTDVGALTLIEDKGLTLQEWVERFQNDLTLRGMVVNKTDFSQDPEPHRIYPWR